MELLHEMDRGIIEARSTEALLTATLKHIQELIPCQSVGVVVFDYEQNEAQVFVAEINGPSEVGPGFRRPMPPADWFSSFGPGRMKVVADLRELSDPIPVYEQPLKEGMRSILHVLLMVENQPIGLFKLLADSPNFFTDEHQEIAAEVASQFAIAIHQMHLSKALERHADQLEQKVAQRTTELQAAKERVEAILNSSPDGILLAHADFTIRQTNAAFDRLFACEPDTYFNQPLTALFHIEDGDLASQVLQVNELESQVSNLEVQARLFDGTNFDADLSLGFIKDYGLVCTIRDISEHKQAENAIKAKLEEELEFQRYLQALHEISIELTPIEDTDEFYRRAVTLGLERLGLERLALFLHDEERDLAIGTYGTDVHGNLSDERHVQFPPTDEHIMVQAFHRVDRFAYVESANLQTALLPTGLGWNAAAVLWNGTKSLGWLVADNGVSHQPATKPQLETLALYAMKLGALLAQKRSNAALRESEEKYRSLIETMRGGLAIFDVDHRISYVNDRFCELMGYSRDELMGARAEEYLDDINAGKINVQLERRRALKSSSYEVAVRHKSGRLIHLLVSGSPLFDKNGTYSGSFAVMTDITTQKQAETALQQALVKEKELGDLKSHFVSMASHEFRTPLTAILSSAGLLRDYADRLPDEKKSYHFDTIESQVERMTTLLDDVLLIGKSDAGASELNPTILDLVALCEEIVQELQSLPKTTCHLLFSHTCTDDCAKLMADEKLMRQIITNLLTNAIKYSSPSSIVRLDLACQNQGVVMRFADEGIGIPEKDQAHLFEAFHRASNVGATPGTGLGLVIVKRAVDLHGGSITFESVVDEGTTFIVRLPQEPVGDKTDGG
jgi:PAS domain S-box-containing protein